MMRHLVQTFRVRMMRRRRSAYRELFGPGPAGFTPAQEIALADLKRFCHAASPTWAADPREHALREGRREVWLRIQHFLALRDEQIADIRETEDDD